MNGTDTTIQSTSNPVGRRTVMTDDALSKLKEAFLMGCSDTEACLMAEISCDSLYRYQNDNPDYALKKEEWKSNPFLLARKTIINDLKNVDTAKWLMEKYDKKVSASAPQNNTQVNIFGQIKDELTITKTEESDVLGGQHDTDNSGLQGGDTEVLPSGGQERDNSPVPPERSPNEIS
jgi:hypothetical protein